MRSSHVQPGDKSEKSQNEASFEDGVLVSVITRYYMICYPEPRDSCPRVPGKVSSRAVIALRLPTSIPHKRVGCQAAPPVPPPLTEAVAATKSESSSESLPTRIRSQTQVAAAARAVAEAAAAAAAKTDS